MMNARRDDFDKRFVDYTDQVATHSAARANQFEAATAAHSNAVEFALGSHSRRIETSLGDALARFEGAIDGRGRDLVVQIGDRSALLSSDLVAKLAQIEDISSTAAARSTRSSASATTRRPPCSTPVCKPSRSAPGRIAGRLDDARKPADADRGRARPARPRAHRNARPQYARDRQGLATAVASSHKAWTPNRRKSAKPWKGGRRS